MKEASSIPGIAFQPSKQFVVLFQQIVNPILGKDPARERRGEETLLIRCEVAAPFPAGEIFFQRANIFPHAFVFFQRVIQRVHGCKRGVELFP